MVSVIQIVLSSVLGDPVLINTAQTNQEQVDFQCSLCLYGVLFIIIVIATIQSYVELKNSSIHGYSKLVEIEEMPGKRVLRLEWEDSQNAVPGSKHYLIRRRYGILPFKDVGSTDQFFFIDRTFDTNRWGTYVIVCIEDQRVSHSIMTRGVP